MRKFSVNVTVPSNCGCCGALLQPNGINVSPGQYRMELPEGELPTSVEVAGLARVTLSRGLLRVELRQRPNTDGAWALMSHYNPDAFGRVVESDVDVETASGKQFWLVYESKLPEFKPWYATWHAELVFVEIDPVTRHALHGKTPVKNAARVSVRLESL
jgi:hypothetical protein